MNNPTIREFRLSSAGSGRGVSCDANGAFVGAVPLLKRSLKSGREIWEPRANDELSATIGSEFGLPVDMSSKAGGLLAIARALNEGDIARAQIATVLLAIPEPPALSKDMRSREDSIKFIRELYRSDLIKWDADEHPRRPAGAPDSQGGQFAPKGEGDSNAVATDSQADAADADARLQYAAYAPGPNDMMSASAKGQMFIKEQEVLHYTLYDSNHKHDWTIGWGHAVRGAEHRLYDHAVLTDAQAEALFQSDLAVAENAVRNNVRFALNQNQFDALTDLAFNVGAHGFSASSTLLYLNSASDFSSAQFGDLMYALGIWSGAFGSPNRRQKEIALYNTPADSSGGGI